MPSVAATAVVEAEGVRSPEEEEVVVVGSDAAEAVG